MATMTIKNIPDDVYKRLKQSAKLNRRSINSEAIVCLERAFGSIRIDPQAFLAGVRARRESMSGVFITDDELHKAKNEGRP